MCGRQVSHLLLQLQLSDASLEERRQFASGLRVRRAGVVVLRAVAEHESDVGETLLRLRVRHVEQLALNRAEVHRTLDHLVVVWCLKNTNNVNNNIGI